MKLNVITKYYTCENVTTIPNTAFVTLPSCSVDEIDGLSRLLSISATNIPPILSPICFCKDFISGQHCSCIFKGQQYKKKFLTFGDNADKPCRNVGKRKHQHTVRNIPEEQRPPKRWFSAAVW
jgi:hypothetical protein